MVLGPHILFLFFNIFEGGKERLPQITKFIRQKDYKFVAFSELNGFTNASFQEWMSHGLGFPHSAFLSTRTGYHMGVASHYPLKVIEMNTSEPFHHGYIFVHIHALNHAVMVTHLGPFSSAARQNEVRHLIEAVEKSNLPTLLFGDLNTLSPRDHFPDETKEILRSTRRLRKKFLLPPKKHGRGELREIDFLPMELLLQTFDDVGIPNDHTVPTGVALDAMHAVHQQVLRVKVSES